MGGSKRDKKDREERKSKKSKHDTGAYKDDDDKDGGDITEDVPQAATREVEEVAPEDEFGAKDYRSSLELKNDHNKRPLWIAPNGHIFLNHSHLSTDMLMIFS